MAIVENLKAEYDDENLGYVLDVSDRVYIGSQLAALQTALKAGEHVDMVSTSFGLYDVHLGSDARGHYAQILVTTPGFRVAVSDDDNNMHTRMGMHGWTVYYRRLDR